MFYQWKQKSLYLVMNNEEDWGQFVYIHSDMSEYKQNIHQLSNKYIVHQYLHNSYEEIGDYIDGSDNSNVPNVLPMTQTSLFTHPGMYLLIGTFNAINYLSTFLGA